MTKPGYWSLAFASGAYDFFSPFNYNAALEEAAKEANLKPTDVVLDAGSGMGSLIPMCGSWLKKGGKLVCMDIDQKGLSAAKRRAEALGFENNVSTKEADFTQSGEFKPDEFDVVLSLFSLYAVTDEVGRQRALQNFYSTLKVGGKFILEVPSMDYAATSILRDARERFEKTVAQKIKANVRNILLIKWLKRLQGNLDSGVFHKFSVEELKSLLSKTGFKEIQIRKTYGGNALLATATK
jgi:ubiquinone/menaquinone biosynthesis C-methylase UbiE